MWKWPPAEIRNGRRTRLVIQLGNCDIFRTFFCRICILRHGWGQFTITCHRCYAIFLQDQPFFSNFPLFEVLETQLTFKSVGEPDYTAAHLSTSQNIKVAIFMEQENIRIGRERFYEGIFTTNANRLTQMISRTLGYQILSTIQVNQYEDSSGNQPFASAPDDLVTEVALKRF